MIAIVLCPALRDRLLIVGLFLALCAGPPTPVSAQVARGHVRSPAGTPIDGALVNLLDSIDVPVARALSDSAGRFRLEAPRAGRYRVRALRIGFEPSTTDLITLGAGQIVEVSIVASAVRVQLSTVRVQARQRCDGSTRARTPAENALWEQAMGSLAALSLRPPGDLTATIVSIERVLDARGRRVLRQQVVQRTGRVTQPWRSMPADMLRQRGFVWREAGDTLTYIAPSVDVLLSPTFLQDHCVRPLFRDDATEVGVAFEPIATRRSMPEIGGTLWLSSENAELRRMEFSFTAIPGLDWSREATGAVAGGSMRFARLPDGTVFIAEWELRIPLFAASGPGSRAPRVANVQTTGGRTLLLRRAADTLYRSSLLAITGAVRDEANRPHADVEVAVVGASGGTRTDASGRFAIADLVPGRHELRVRSALLRALGRDTIVDVLLVDSTTAVSIRMPPLRDVVRASCREQGIEVNPSTTGALAGVVDGARDMPIVSDSSRATRVVAEWRTISGSAVSLQVATRSADAIVDSTGAFQLCGVPVNTAIRVRAVSGRARGAPLTVRVSSDSSVALIRVPSVSASPSVVTIAGVVADTAGMPLAEVEVSVPSAGVSTRSDARGQYALRDVPDTAPLLLARRLGLEPRTVRLRAAAGDTLVLPLTMRRVTVLDAVGTVARAISPTLADFEARRRTGIGRFFTPDDLRRQDGRSLNAVLAQVPGLRLIAGNGGRLWMASMRSSTGGAALDRTDIRNGAARACYAKVYRDGVLLYGGAAAEPLFDLSVVRPEELDAIEYYAGGAQVPTQFGGLAAQCGVVLLWSRRD